MQTARSKQQRKQHALELLRDESHLWLASATSERDAHLVPLTYYWDGEQFTFGTDERFRTARNLRRTGRARAAVGTPGDVVIVEGAVTWLAPAELDPTIADEITARTADDIDYRTVPGTQFFQLRPDRIEAYTRFAAEQRDRRLMVDGGWLVD